MGAGVASEWKRRRSLRRAVHPWLDRCFSPIDIASLVFFRIAFGALMVWDLGRYLAAGALDTPQVHALFHFKYFGFEWVPALEGSAMRVLLLVLMLSATGVAVGLCYRVCAVVFALGFAWFFLMDAAQYLNHFYLICLISLLAIALPAHRRLSVDCLLNPRLRSELIPAWSLWIVRGQMAIVYFYGGIAKLNADWLRGEPVRTWLVSRTGTLGVDSLFTSEWAVWVICYGGLAFDLLIVPLLLWRKTRMFAFIVAVAFHLTNSALFQIGVFPWLGIALTSLFFPPDWPRRCLARIRMPLADARLTLRYPGCSISVGRRRWIALFLSAYLVAQLLLPLRHFLYPGAVSWTEEGHRFAWHMKLRAKTGTTSFFLLDPGTGEVWMVDPLAYLTPRQQQKMNGHPEMILQFGQYITQLMAEKGRTNLHLHVIAHAALNGREPALLIDPDVNLASQRLRLRPSRWILPLENRRPEPSWFLSTSTAEAGVQSL